MSPCAFGKSFAETSRRLPEVSPRPNYNPGAVGRRGTAPRGVGQRTSWGEKLGWPQLTVVFNVSRPPPLGRPAAVGGGGCTIRRIIHSAPARELLKRRQ